MLKQVLIMGALLVGLSSSAVLADGPQNGSLVKSGTQAMVVRGRGFYRPRTTTNSIPSTQPRYTTPSGSGPAYQRYSQLPYYMRAERKALGMFP
jgi:hypothetical protein